ncbi:hypothetical protein M430DRAFT_33074, partial [Amorphotheca resinae ATCC 22711]
MTAMIVIAATFIPLVFDLQRHTSPGLSPPYQISGTFHNIIFFETFWLHFRMGITTCTNSILGSNSFVQYSAYNELTTTVSTSTLVLIARTLAFTADLTALSLFPYLSWRLMIVTSLFVPTGRLCMFEI